MKTQILKTLSAGCILVGLAACSFNGDSTADQTKNYLDDRSRIMSMYQPLTGTYEGQITVSSSQDEDSNQTKTIKLQLAIYTQDVQNGNDPNGQARPLPSLIIRYRQLDIVRPDEIMTSARYVPESGELMATNSAATPGSGGNNGGSGAGNGGQANNSAANICNSAGTIATTLKNTHIKGDTISGTVLRGNGKLGTFTVTRISNDAVSSVADPVAECNDRLAIQYKAISGLYKGTLVHTPENGGSTMDVTMNLNYIPVATANGSITATLMGSFQYGTVPIASMTAVYRQDVTPAQLSMSYLVSPINGGGFSLSGTLSGDTYTAEAYSGNLGHMGTVVVKRVPAL